MRSASMMGSHYRGGIEQGGYASLYIPHIPTYALLQARRGKALVDLVLEEARRRGRGHELAVHFGRHAAVLDHPAVTELDLQQLRFGIVAGRADLARIDAFAFHAASQVVCATTPAGLIFLSVGQKMSWIDAPSR